jgi:hypothetical protein
VFPIIGGRKVEQALGTDLTVEDNAKIEAVVPFDFGRPHSLLSGSRYEPVNSKNPGSSSRDTGFYKRIEEVKASPYIPSEIETDTTVGNSCLVVKQWEASWSLKIYIEL